MVLVAVGEIDRRALTAAQYALTVRAGGHEAVHVALDPAAALDLCHRWPTSALARLPLRTLPDTRGVGASIAAEAARLLGDGYDEVVVVAGELSMPGLRRYVLHDRTAAAIRRAVNGVPGALAVLLPVAVASYPQVITGS